MTRRSGWCSDHMGECSSPGLHERCQERITKGLLAGCGCTAYNGHQNTESLSTKALSDPSGGRNNGV